MTWFWSTPEWRDYSEAYGSPEPPDNFARPNLIVDLGEERAMWSRIRHGHQAAIRRGMTHFDLDQYVGGDAFAVYRELHRLANGPVRSEETFRLMSTWVPKSARAYVACHNGPAVAAALFIHHDGGVYYASAPRHPELRPPDAAHLLVWTAMLQYSIQGYRWMAFGPVPDERSTDKERSIAHFKKGFGPTERTWPW